MEPVKRPYHSPKRERQARQTREQIVGAARRLFARDGFAKTTVEAIAREAGVSAQTVYASVGSKRGIVLALLDRMEIEGGNEELRRELAASKDPRWQLRAIVRFNRRLFERGRDVLDVVMATRADADVEAFGQAGEARRREGQARWVRAWAEAGVLRSDLDEGAAADVLWALTGPELYWLFAVNSGWSGSKFEEWLFGTLESQLFGETSPSG
jgi:TetR/AcrR family transcriptional regulator, regulator of cefoperazone and chloramphenicol sensitivity